MTLSLSDALKAGLACRCPQCGEGSVFSGYLQIAPMCARCGLSFAGQDTADGPAFFVMMPLSILTAVLALLFEVYVHPPLWQHIVIWPTFIIASIALLLRSAKATLMALQYRYRNLASDQNNTWV